MIVTHTSPDLDAIRSTWLLLRHRPELGPVAFTSERDSGASVFNVYQTDAVCDTGSACDEQHLRFDHHQDPNLPSATMLVYMHLEAQGALIAHLRQLVELVDAGDFGRIEAKPSYSLGLHALLNAFKTKCPDDHQGAWDFVASLLDLLADQLKQRQDARESLESRVRWKSADGLVWAIAEGGQGSGSAAAQQGARLVVWSDTYERDGRTAYNLGCMRYNAQEPHVGDLVATVAASAWLDNVDLYEELETWFRHKQGFMAGVGSPKADPRWAAPAVPVETIAQAISAAWERDQAARAGEHDIEGCGQGTCRSCGAAILWKRLETGRAIPLSVATIQPHSGKKWALSHFSDCPDAKDWGRTR